MKNTKLCKKIAVFSVITQAAKWHSALKKRREKVIKAIFLMTNVQRRSSKLLGDAHKIVAPSISSTLIHFLCPIRGRFFYWILIEKHQLAVCNLLVVGCSVKGSENVIVCRSFHFLMRNFKHFGAPTISFKLNPNHSKVLFRLKLLP